MQGRGSRITMKDKDGVTLADFIIGKQVPERQGFRFVRVPGENRVYASRVDLDISTKFQDWIEAKLLEVEASKIERVVLDNYSVNERTFSVQPGEKIELAFRDEVWTSSRSARSTPPRRDPGQGASGPQHCRRSAQTGGTLGGS